MRKFSFPKLMEGENIIYEAGYSRVVVITQIIFIVLACIIMGWLILFLKNEPVTLFHLLLFNTPIIMLLLALYFSEVLSYPFFSSYIITDKRIIINRSGLKNFISNFIFCKKSSILFDEITNINTNSTNNVIEIRYKNKKTEKLQIFLLVPENQHEFIDILKNQIEIYKNSYNNYIDFKYVQRAVKENPLRFFLYLIAIIVLFLGLLIFNITNATIITAKIVKIFNPNNSIPYKSLGSAYKEKENYDLAIKYLKKAVELDPENLSSSIRLANSFYKKGLYDEAIKYKEKVAPSIDKADINEYHEYNNFIILISKNENKRFVWQDCGFSKDDFANNVLTRKICNPNNLEDDNVNRCSTDYERLGDFYKKKEKYDKVIIYYKKSIFHDLNNYNSYKKLSDIYNIQGFSSLAKSYSEKAEKLETTFKLRNRITK